MEQREHEDYLNLYRSQAQNHSRTQQSKLKKISSETPINQMKDFLGNGFDWLYHYIKSRFGKKHPFMDYTSEPMQGIFEMYSERGDKDNIKIVVAADWASYTKESKNIGRLMDAEQADYSIHLGDTYFVGAPDEIKSNFIDKQGCWPKASSGSFALPGNHEFYSNGNPYFDMLLPAMQIKTSAGMVAQTASFFCLQNDHWRVLGLDTGYYSVGRLLLEYIFRPDARLHKKIIEWLTNIVRPGDDKRGLVIFTHHQYCSAFEERYSKAAECLATLIGQDREVIWIWGHEHRFAVYGKYQSSAGIKAYGRCIGHAGMPAEIGKLRWGKQHYTTPNQSKAVDNKLVFFDNRKRTILKKTIVGHNGYAVLSMHQNKLTIEYKDETTWLFKEHWELDINTGKITGTAENNAAVPLNLFAASFDDAVK